MPSTVAVKDLKIGMFIRLELGWMSHPFPLSSFRIASADQIATIRGLGLEARDLAAREERRGRRGSARAGAPPVAEAHALAERRRPPSGARSCRPSATRCGTAKRSSTRPPRDAPGQPLLVPDPPGRRAPGPGAGPRHAGQDAGRRRAVHPAAVQPERATG
jgi:hypothetical protein